MRNSAQLALVSATLIASQLLLAPTAKAATAEPGADKSVYTFFNPTPRKLMREFNTDRPDKTESPYSLDAGHYQFETDLAVVTRDQGATSAIFNNINLKAGITSSSDLQVIIGTFRKDFGTPSAQGVTDLAVRYKFNFFGNESDESAFGVIPYVKLPTQSKALGRSSIEAGLIAPYARKLTSIVDMGTQLVFDIKRDSDAVDSKYYPASTESVTFGYDLGHEVGTYTELFAQQLFTPAETLWNVTADAGITWRMTPEMQWDAGINVGVTDAADDLNPFLGLSVRF